MHDYSLLTLLACDTACSCLLLPSDNPDAVAVLCLKYAHTRHQRLRPILPYMCILLSSHYTMIAATAMDLHSCMNEIDRQNGQKVPSLTLA
jgi:hypothetical protein